MHVINRVRQGKHSGVDKLNGNGTGTTCYDSSPLGLNDGGQLGDKKHAREVVWALGMWKNILPRVTSSVNNPVCWLLKQNLMNTFYTCFVPQVKLLHGWMVKNSIGNEYKQIMKPKSVLYYFDTSSVFSKKQTALLKEWSWLLSGNHSHWWSTVWILFSTAATSPLAALTWCLSHSLHYYIHLFPIVAPIAPPHN